MLLFLFLFLSTPLDLLDMRFHSHGTVTANWVLEERICSFGTAMWCGVRFGVISNSHTGGV
jgi:hypothetical protein